MKNRYFSSRRFYAIFKKELIQLKRDRLTFIIILLLPIIELMLFGYAINSDPRNIPTAVLSQDNSIVVRDFIAGLKNSEYFSIDYNITSDAQGQQLLRQGKALFLISIPDHFNRDLIRKNHPQILVEADASDPISIAGALSTINNILTTTIQKDLSKGVLAYLDHTKPPFSVIIHKLYNPGGLTNYNILPGLIGVVLTITGIMMTALTSARERERGTLENLLIMPVKPIEMMFGKILLYILIGYSQSFIIIAMAILLFHIPMLGSLFLFYAVLIIFIICNLALGFTLSVAAKNQVQAMQMGLFLIMPCIMLSGFMFPFYGMPYWAQKLGDLLPITYFIRITRGIMLKGNTFTEIWPNLWPLLLFLIIICSIAVKLFDKKID